MRYVMIAVVAAAMFTGVTASAEVGEQIAKLFPDDGAEDDGFGISVGIGAVAGIVGAWTIESYGVGFAYLFDGATGKTLGKLLPDDGAAGDAFGYAVAISGSTAIVGALGHGVNGDTPGAAYLFDASTGRQVVKLLAADGAAGDLFGYAVAISGTTVIVGAVGDEDNGSSSGSAYLFDTTTGAQIAKLVPDDGSAFDKFGVAVAISGNTAIVGAPDDDDNGLTSGSAYLFDAVTGRQIAKLLPRDGAASEQFGYSVAISGITAIVGAPIGQDDGVETGAAYVFDTRSGRQLAKLLPDDGAQYDGFGSSVACAGATAIVGSRSDGDNGLGSGSAYLFEVSAGEPIAKLLPDDGAEGDEFGLAVAISDTRALVGAWMDDDNGDNSGSAYLFDAREPCAGDSNDDEIVDLIDIDNVVLDFGTDGSLNGGDLDGSGIVDIDDVIVVVLNFGSCPGQ